VVLAFPACLSDGAYSTQDLQCTLVPHHAWDLGVMHAAWPSPLCREGKPDARSRILFWPQDEEEDIDGGEEEDAAAEAEDDEVGFLCPKPSPADPCTVHEPGCRQNGFLYSPEVLLVQLISSSC